uniref:Uncharacterized protein n=1 Tax=Ignisphaera aggregans TaxID=334771 RepID=A0A7C4BCB4_9CREN
MHSHSAAYTITLYMLLLLTFSAVGISVQASYGGDVPTPSGATLYSVCGDASRGLLFSVGTDGTNGLVYRIIDLTSSGYELFVQQSPSIHGKKYISLRFYACKIMDDYLFVVGEAQRSATDWRGSIIVYSISTKNSVASRTYDIRRVSERFIDVEVRKVGDTYYIYALLITTGETDNVRLAYTSFSGASLETINSDVVGTGSGYGISVYGGYLGVLWRGSSNNLYLSVYSVLSGEPDSPTHVVVLQNFNGVWASATSYSEGFLIAAESSFYKVYFNGSLWVAETLATNAFSGTPYAVLVAEKNSTVAAYTLSQVESSTYITAIDLTKKTIAYIDIIAQAQLSNYGDATTTWVDSNNKIVSSETPSARPIMLCGAIDSLVYYDLTRGGSFPYPVPEPWLASLAVIIVTTVFIVVILGRGFRSSLPMSFAS